MKGVILAAGESKRLRPLTNDTPKCLLNIGGQSIIDYQIKSLVHNQINEVVVVVGYMAEAIMKKLTSDYPDLEFKFIYNPIYGQTNTVYSLWLASQELDDDVIYFNADVLAHPEVINRLVKSEYDTCLANNHNSIDEEAIKVVMNTKGRIQEIGKQINLTKAAGEFIGIAKFSKKYNQLFKKNLAQVVNHGEINNYFESAIEEGLSEYAIYEIDVSDLPVIEIDFPEDLEKAKKLSVQLWKKPKSQATEKTMRTTSKEISVVGAGSWGTAIAQILAENGHKVRLWTKERNLLKTLRKDRVNELYLPTKKLHANISFYNSPSHTLANCKYLVCAVPTVFTKETMGRFVPAYRQNLKILNVSKGIENRTFKRTSEIIEETLQPKYPIAVLSGPNIAKEVSARILTKTIVACRDLGLAKEWKNLFENDYFKVYLNTDVVGVELGGALKNIISLAAGISDGLGYKTNTKSAIMTRGISEIFKLGEMLGAKPATFSGLSGIGDLIVSCISPNSRNRRSGELLAKGKSISEIKKELGGMVAEGIGTTKSVYQLSLKYKLSMPITTCVYRIIYENKNPSKQFLGIWENNDSVLEM